mgnify:CR=1 FL=1
MTDKVISEEQIVRCMKCSKCQAVCPVYKQIGRESQVARGKIRLAKALQEGEIEPQEAVDAIFACTFCGACTSHCPALVETADVLADARAELVESGAALPEGLQAVRKGINEEGNPFGQPRDERGSWLDADMVGKPSENLYFAGCNVSYSSNKIAKSLFRILDKIGFDYTAAGSEETCCGDPLWRAGDRKGFEALREANIAKWRELGVKRVFSTCPGCVGAFRHHYPTDEFEFVHVTELLAQLVADGTLTFSKSLDKVVAYHDGCDLGRHMGIYDAPREILKAIPGINLIEFPRNREDAACCGGPLAASNPDLAQKIAGDRIKEADDAGAELIVTSCGQCMVTLRDGAKSIESEITVQDLPLILQRLV